MTVTVGGDKISRLTLAGNEFANVEDVWLPVEVNSLLKGYPAIMHYDRETKLTSFYGMLGTDWTSGRTWKGTLMELPEGFHFAKNVDSTFPFVGSVSQMSVSPSSTNVKCSVDGRNLNVDFSWPYGSYYASGQMILSLSNLYNRLSGTWKMWTTDAIVPD